jgi:hypothetical protein
MLPENHGHAPSESSFCLGGLGGGALGFSLLSSCFMLSNSILADLSAWSGGRQAANFSNSNLIFYFRFLHFYLLYKIYRAWVI